MAVVKGVKEKVHLPLYDSLAVKAGTSLGTNQTTNTLRFFQDVTGKTKLETNMQASSLLPHWNTFEARAMRVILSDLCPTFPDKPTVTLDGLSVSTPADQKKAADTVGINNLNVRHYASLSRKFEDEHLAHLDLSPVEIAAWSSENNRVSLDRELKPGECVRIDRGDLDRLRRLLSDGGAVIPCNEQLFPKNGCGDLISRFIYNSVTTLFVGEKIMIQVPTFFFPSGAGPYTEDGRVVTHGYPSPEATFRFAEPVFIDAQQNFRVEIEIPDSEVLADLKRCYGPLFVWVVIDGFMTRDVQ